MTNLLDHCPTPPDWLLPWETMRQQYDWLNALYDCPQDPIHHAEGDVGTHTRMVCEELLTLPGWRSLGEEDRKVLFAAAVLHDMAKPECTRVEDDGRITSRGHSRRGAVRARGLLWRMGVPFALRERVCALIRFHQSPYFLIDRPDAQRLAVEVSQTARCDHLGLLAEADVRGRICNDKQRLLDNVALFVAQVEEMGILSSPYAFPTEHQRVMYFRDEKRTLDTPAHAAFRCEVVLMSGLPGAGKDHHVRTHLSDRAILTLDDLRDELGVDPADDQGEVIQEARERARDYLRQGTPFVWNATNITRQMRGLVLNLLLNYHARVEVRYLEVSAEMLFAQNSQRSRKVPDKVMERLIDRWELPDLTEAHAVTTVVREEG